MRGGGEKEEDERGEEERREENPSAVLPFLLFISFSSLRSFVHSLLFLIFFAACFIIRPCSPFSIPLQGSRPSLNQRTRSRSAPDAAAAAPFFSHSFANKKENGTNNTHVSSPFYYSRCGCGVGCALAHPSSHLPMREKAFDCPFGGNRRRVAMKNSQREFDLNFRLRGALDHFALGWKRKLMCVDAAAASGRTTTTTSKRVKG